MWFLFKEKQKVEEIQKKYMYGKLKTGKLENCSLFEISHQSTVYFVEKIWECVFILNPSENTVHWWSHYQEPPYLCVPVLVCIRIKFQSNYFSGEKCEGL